MEKGDGDGVLREGSFGFKVLVCGISYKYKQGVSFGCM